MAAWLPFSVQMEVFKNPGGLVARTLYENRGDAASFFADIAQEPGGVPEDIKKLAQDYVNTTPNQRPAKKNLFGLSRDQLKLVVGGTGVIVNADGTSQS